MASPIPNKCGNADKRTGPRSVWTMTTYGYMEDWLSLRGGKCLTRDQYAQHDGQPTAPRVVRRDRLGVSEDLAE
jgi:hypothetical protein